jgi:hypothetical protein
MTPPFTTADAVARVILSWGTLITNPSASLPDLDLVVAGPINQQSLTTFGTGIVNFENKDLHSSTSNVLPYVKIITDSAQGFGPEVMDFQDGPESGFAIGFSDSYAPGSAANAYEIWVDRPNSSPNLDSAFVTISETNSFIVVYRHDGVSQPSQILYNVLTGVEWAYGFYNGDQWNKVPSTATLWHIVDFLPNAQVKFDGFPESGDGAKYGFDGASFQAQKTIPCGHVAARGASPTYCPATLSYPQSKK